jgi:hypothetical protein
MSSNTGLQPSPPLPSTLGLSLGLCPVAPHLPFLEWPLLSLGRLAERPQDRVLKTRSGRFQVLANYPDVQMRSAWLSRAGAWVPVSNWGTFRAPSNYTHHFISCD